VQAAAIITAYLGMADLDLLPENDGINIVESTEIDLCCDLSVSIVCSLS
jgi:hypothetical protein